MMQLEIHHVTLSRGSRRLFVDLCWIARPGSVAWITGENGHGKSSLLRVLAGRDVPSAGSVAVRGANECRDVTYFHPNMHLPPKATFGEWKQLCAVLPGAATPLHAVGLLPSLTDGRQLDELSTGEAKRILLHTLLARETPLTVLDEPYEHLSPPARQMLTSLLVERARRNIVVVATNQEIPADVDQDQVLHLDSSTALSA